MRRHATGRRLSTERSARFASEAFLGVSFQVVEHLAISAIANVPITSFYVDLIDGDTPLFGLGATWLF